MSIEKTPTGPPGILVVEDDESVRGVISKGLKRFGYQVHVAESGEHALELLACIGRSVGLMITDVVLPGMSGQELCRRARDRFPELRILCISGYLDETLQRHGEVDSGALGFLPSHSAR
jgi:CheY-like chemotaxis protein